jgi:hypothetical protein
MLWSHIFKLRDHTIFLKFQVWKKLKIRTEGLESRVKGTPFHVIFLDYDNIDDKTLIEDELQSLQEWFEIGNFYVFETRDKGRHCMCIDALRAKDAHEIVYASGCDAAFKKAVLINEHRCWVLRFDEKGNRPPPKYLYTVKSPYEGRNLQSLGHSIYLRKFGLEIELKNPVGEERIGIEGYNTTDEHKKEGED